MRSAFAVHCSCSSLVSHVYVYFFVGQDSGYPTYDGIGGDAFDSHPDSNRGVYDAANSEPYADSGLYPEVRMPYSSRGNASNVYYNSPSPTPNFFYPGDTGHSGYSAPNWY